MAKIDILSFAAPREGEKERFLDEAKRLLLSGRFGENFRLEYAPGGKPYVDGECFFSISHSENLVCAAFSDCETGVDIEFIRPISGIERGFFNTEAERKFIRLSNDKNRAFLWLWTRKEALYKAMGTGFNGAEVIDCLKNHVNAGFGDWFLNSFEAAPGYIGALCTKKSRSYKINSRKFNPGP